MKMKYIFTQAGLLRMASTYRNPQLRATPPYSAASAAAAVPITNASRMLVAATIAVTVAAGLMSGRAAQTGAK